MDKILFKVESVHVLLQAGLLTLLQGRKMHIFFLRR